MLARLKRYFSNPPPATSKRKRISVDINNVSDLFVIGDIHGRLDLLKEAESRILSVPAKDARPRLVIGVGDFIDRGPQSRQVISHLFKPLPQPYHRICLCGNHDDSFLQFIDTPGFDRGWLDFGGMETLRSYGVDTEYLLKRAPNGSELKATVRADVPEQHVEFLRELPISLTIGPYLFVHAGIRPGLALDEQSDADLMWIREPFLSEGPKLDFTVIHGHTPSTEITFGPNRIGVDTGAYMTGRLDVLHIAGPNDYRVLR